MRNVPSVRRLLASVTTVAVASLGLLAATPGPAQAALPGAYSFGGANFGGIPDGTPPCDGVLTPRDVTFEVTGVPIRSRADVRLTGVMITHAYIGDVTATLIAPDATSFVIFGRTGAFSNNLGDNSNALGPYAFADTDIPSPGGWWSAANLVDSANNIPAGTYRTSTVGGNAGGGQPTNLTAAFAGVANPNGTWILRFVDRCQQDVGSVSAATLEITPVAKDCSTQETALKNAEGALAAAQAAKTSAAAAAAAAQAALAKAKSAVAKAKVKLTKAKKALKAAQAAQNPAKIDKALAKLKKAKKAAKKAKKAAKKAAATAKTALAAATQAAGEVTAAEAAKASAESALTDCENSEP